MKDGAVALVYNPWLQERVPTAVRGQVEDARARILAGTLDPLTGP